MALALVPMMLAAGAGIDMVRANYVQSVLQDAADAAALAGATSGKTSEAELNLIVNEYPEVNDAKSVLNQIDKIDSKLDKKARLFEVTIKGKLDTSLTQLAGINSMDLGARAEVILGGAALEVALVLDNIASMNSDGRMDSLKVAASSLIDKLVDLKATGADVQIGIVPFADYVNVGLSNRTEPWMKMMVCQRNTPMKSATGTAVQLSQPVPTRLIQTLGMAVLDHERHLSRHLTINSYQRFYHS